MASFFICSGTRNYWIYSGGMYWSLSSSAACCYSANFLSCLETFRPDTLNGIIHDIVFRDKIVTLFPAETCFIKHVSSVRIRKQLNNTIQLSVCPQCSLSKHTRELRVDRSDLLMMLADVDVNTFSISASQILWILNAFDEEQLLSAVVFHTKPY